MEVRYIEWLDSCAQSFWSDEKLAKDLRPDHCSTVGFVVNETDEFVTVIQSFTNRDGEQDQAGHTLCIPKFAITSWNALKPKAGQ